MSAVVGAGVIAKMDQNRDHPLTDEQYHKNQDGSTWSETWGTKGLYVASNATGAWETYGPFAGASRPVSS